MIFTVFVTLIWFNDLDIGGPSLMTRFNDLDLDFSLERGRCASVMNLYLWRLCCDAGNEFVSGSTYASKKDYVGITWLFFSIVLEFKVQYQEIVDVWLWYLAVIFSH